MLSNNCLKQPTILYNIYIDKGTNYKVIEKIHPLLMNNIYINNIKDLILEKIQKNNLDLLDKKIMEISIVEIIEDKEECSINLEVYFDVNFYDVFILEEYRINIIKIKEGIEDYINDYTKKAN